MITILCATGSFLDAGGYVDCRHCHHRTVFPVACEVVLLIINEITVIYEASTGGILHDCRHVRVLEDSGVRHLRPRHRLPSRTP